MEELAVDRLYEISKKYYSKFYLNELLSSGSFVNPANQIYNDTTFANPGSWSLKTPLYPYQNFDFDIICCNKRIENYICHLEFLKKKLLMISQIEKKLTHEKGSNKLMSFMEKFSNMQSLAITPNILPLLAAFESERTPDLNQISSNNGHETNKDSGISSLSEYSLKPNENFNLNPNCYKFIELIVIQQRITALREYQSLINRHLPSTSLVSHNKENMICQKDSKCVTHQDVSTQTHSESTSNAIVTEDGTLKFCSDGPLEIIDAIQQPNIFGQIVNFNQYLVNLEDKVEAMTQLLFIMCGKDAYEVLRNLKNLLPSPKNCSLLRTSGIMSFLVRCAYANLQKFVETTEQNIRVELPVDNLDLQENTLVKSSLNWHIQLIYIDFNVPNECESLAAHLQRCLVASEIGDDDLAIDLCNSGAGNQKRQKEIKILDLLDPVRIYIYEVFKVVLQYFALVRLVDEDTDTNEAVMADNEGNEELEPAIKGGACIRDLKNIKIDLEQSQIQKLEIGEPPRAPLTLLLKLSYDEEYRNIICEFGGLRALSSFIVFDYFLNEHSNKVTTLFQRILITIGEALKDYENGKDLLGNIVVCRKYCYVTLTNLTFNDQSARGFLCSQPYFLQALIYLLRCPDLSLIQMSATLLRNLSWSPKDILVKVALSNPRLDILSTTLSKLKDLFIDYANPSGDIRGALDDDLERRLYVERVIKDVCAILWNLTSQPLLINEVARVWTSFVEVIPAGFAYISPSNSLDVLERIGGILKNVSEILSTLSSELMPPIYPLVFDTLLQHLRYSTSLTVVSNACNIIRNMTTGNGYSASRCRAIITNTEGCLQMLSRLSWSIHVPIRRGANGVLKNLDKYPSQGCETSVTLEEPKNCEKILTSINGEIDGPSQSHTNLAINSSVKLSGKHIVSVSRENLFQTPMMFSRHSSMSQLSDFSDNCSKTKISNGELLDKSDVESLPTDRVASRSSNRESLIPSSCPSPTHSLDPTQIELNQVLNDRSTLQEKTNAPIYSLENNVDGDSRQEMHYGHYTGIRIEQNQDDTAYVYATENTPFLFSSRYSSLSVLQEDPSFDVEEIPNNFKTDTNMPQNNNSDLALREGPINFVGEDEECYEDEYDEGEEDIINDCIQSVFLSGKNVFDTQLTNPTSLGENVIPNNVFQFSPKSQKALSDSHFNQGISNDSDQPQEHSAKVNLNLAEKIYVCRSHPIVPNFYPPPFTKFYSRDGALNNGLSCRVNSLPKIRGIINASSESQLYKMSKGKYHSIISKRYKSQQTWPLTTAPCLRFNTGIRYGDSRDTKPSINENPVIFQRQNVLPISCSSDNYININSDAFYDPTSFQKPECITLGPDPSFDNGVDNLQIFATEGTPFYLSKTHSFEQLLSHLSTHSLTNTASYDELAHKGVMGTKKLGEKDEECEEEDMIKTYATEGTPYHASRSPSIECEETNAKHCFHDTQDIMYSPDIAEEIKVFNLENTPIEFSKRTSLSEMIFSSSENDLSSGQQYHRYGERKETDQTQQRFPNITETGVNDDEFILAPPPASKSYNKTEYINTKTSIKNFSTHHINPMAECYDINDSPRIYNVEGTPLMYSRQDSYSNLLSPVIGSHGKLSCKAYSRSSIDNLHPKEFEADNEAIKSSYKDQSLPINVIQHNFQPSTARNNTSSPIRSHNISQESLAMEPSPMDEALLNQCIHSALPQNWDKKSPGFDASCDDVLRFDTAKSQSFRSPFNDITLFNSQIINLDYTDALNLSCNDFDFASNLCSLSPQNTSGFCISDLAKFSNKLLTPTPHVFKDKGHKTAHLPSQLSSAPQRQDFYNTLYTHCSLPYEESALLENETISLISDTESDEENAQLSAQKLISISNSPIATNDLSSQRFLPDNNSLIHKSSITKPNAIHGINPTPDPPTLRPTSQTLPKPLVKQRTFVKDGALNQSGVELPTIDLIDDERNIKSAKILQSSLKSDLQLKIDSTILTAVKNDAFETTVANRKTSSRDSLYNFKKPSIPFKPPSSPKNNSKLPQMLKKKGVPGFPPSLPSRGLLNSKLTNKCDTFSKRKSIKAKDTNQTQKKIDTHIVDTNYNSMNGSSLMRSLRTSKIARYKPDN